MSDEQRAKRDEQEELGDIFADIFHSFKDITDVAPIEIIDKLKEAGIVFARISHSIG